MAELNLLKGSFSGKLGELYGSKQYGNYYAKAIPFSHAPHSIKQKSSFTAFARLNRFASGITKVFFNYMGIENGDMLKHNAIAKAFKITVKDNVFRLQNLSEIIANDGTTSTSNITLRYNTNILSANFSTTESVDKENNRAWVCFIISNNGEVIIADAPNEATATLTSSKPLSPGVGYIAGAFRADKENGKIKLHGFSFSQIMYVLDGYLNIDAFKYKAKWSIENNLLITTDKTVSYSEDNLIINTEE